MANSNAEMDSMLAKEQTYQSDWKKLCVKNENLQKEEVVKFFKLKELAKMNEEKDAIIQKYASDLATSTQLNGFYEMEIASLLKKQRLNQSELEKLQTQNKILQKQTDEMKQTLQVTETHIIEINDERMRLQQSIDELNAENVKTVIAKKEYAAKESAMKNE